MVLWTVFLYLLTKSFKHIKINILCNNFHVHKNLVFQSCNKSLNKNRFSCIKSWIHFNVVYSQKYLKKLNVKFTTLINTYFVGYRPFEVVFWNALTTLLPILFFKETTHAYLLNKSNAHNKGQIPLFLLLNYYIWAKSTPWILSLKDE